MNARQMSALMKAETDIDGAMKRFCDDEELYVACLEAFPSDPTMEELEIALSMPNWDDAFTAAHALKGLAGNMGFIPLYLAASNLVVLIRTGRTADVSASFREVKRAYEKIVEAINTGRPKRSEA